MNRLSPGLVGGGVAAFHVCALERLPQAAILRSVFDVDLVRAQAFAAAHGAQAFDDLDAMARSPLDAAIVCAPPMSHHSAALPTDKTISYFRPRRFPKTQFGPADLHSSIAAQRARPSSSIPPAISAARPDWPRCDCLSIVNLMPRRSRPVPGYTVFLPPGEAHACEN